MTTHLKGLSKENQVSAVVSTVHQAIITEFDEDFIAWYHEAKASTTDRADQMRIDIAFTNKISELHKVGFFKTSPRDLRAMAQKISGESPTEVWYGKATTLTHREIIDTTSVKAQTPKVSAI